MPFFSRQIAQFNKKFLVFLQNKISNRLELYFGDAHSVSKALQKKSALRRLDLEHFMVTVNEPKGLVAIYDITKGAVSFCFFLE